MSKTKTTKPTTEATTTSTVDTKEIAVVKAQATKAMTYAGGLTVATKEDYDAALEEGKKIKDILKTITSRKEEITKPLNDALKSARELFKPIETTVDDALATIRMKMTVWYNEEQKRARAEEAKIAARVEKGTLKPETAMRKMDEVAAPEQTAKTDTATGTMRKVQKWRVIDKSKIPLIFMEPNMVAIKTAFKQGQPVPGVEQYEESELSIS